MSRLVRHLAAWLAIFSLLFAQLAVAAYICPVSSVEAPVAATMASMPGCDGLDLDQPALCHAHLHAVELSLDKPDLPAVQPFVPGMLVLRLAPAPLASTSLMDAPAARYLQHAPAPPVALKHCCLRI